jgi:ribonuclease P protein component
VRRPTGFVSVCRRRTAALCLHAGARRAATNSRSAMSRLFAARSNRRLTRLAPLSRFSRVPSGNVRCPPDRRFTRSRRIVRSSEFRNIYESGVRMTSRYFSAFCLPLASDTVPSRFGFTVPRALGKAVLRNRLKRRMREAVRSQFDRLPANWAIVFNPRRTVLEAPFEDLCREVSRLFARCKES